MDDDKDNNYGGSGDENEMDDDVDESDPSYIKPSYVVAIDMHDTMFDTDATTNNTTYIEQCLAACHDLYESLLFVYKRSNPVSVLLANDDDDKTELVGFADTIPEAMTLVRKATTVATHYDLSNFLFTCRRKFTDGAKRNDRTLVYVTRNDSPCGRDDEATFRCTNMMRSIVDSGVRLDVLAYRDERFDGAAFKDAGATVQHVRSADDLLVKLQSMAERSQQRVVRLYLYPTRYASVVVRAVSKTATLYRTKVARQTLQEVKAVPDDDDDDAVDAERYAEWKHPTDDTIVTLTKEEYDKCKVDVRPGIHLRAVGKSIVRRGYTIAESHLVVAAAQPDEYLRLYDDAWAYCRSRQRVLLCRMKMQSNHVLRNVQLTPYELNDRRSFHMEVVPTVENVRRFDPPVVLPTLCEAGLSLMDTIVDRLTVDFHPSQVPNPSMAAHQAYLKSKLFETKYEQPLNVLDDADRKVDALIGDLTDDFNAVFRLNAAAAGAPAEPKAKRAKKN